MIYIFEGMDNCLKDTLIQKVRGKLSPETQVLKYSSPPKEIADPEEYQKKHFLDMFNLMESTITTGKRNLILNRAHLGEYVYSPIYRGYKGDWIFNLEDQYLKSSSEHSNQTLLILLYDSDNEQLKLREDGQSLSKRSDSNFDLERGKFKEAFAKSLLPKKLLINLTDYLMGSNSTPMRIDADSILSKIMSLN